MVSERILLQVLAEQKEEILNYRTQEWNTEC